MVEFSDTELLNFIESRATPGLRWIARESTTGRGYRVHQHDGIGSPTAREAISAAISNKQIRVECSHKWEHFMAEKTPYSFCRACQSTLYNGKVFPKPPEKK